MKRFTIKTRKAGEHSWKTLHNVPIFAGNFVEAKKLFKDWYLGWLGEINNDHAIIEYGYVLTQPPQHTYEYDSHIYTIRRLL